MKFDYYTFTVGAQYISALFNGDYTGLDDKEEAELEQFLNNLPVNNGHFDLIYDGETEFSRCEISGLYGDCLEVRLYFPLVEASA